MGMLKFRIFIISRRLEYFGVAWQENPQSQKTSEAMSKLRHRLYLKVHG